MNFKDLVNRAVSLIAMGNREHILNSIQSWILEDYILYVTDGNLDVNFLMRGAIGEILNNEKFKSVKNISQIYEQLKHAQNSY